MGETNSKSIQYYPHIIGDHTCKPNPQKRKLIKAKILQKKLLQSQPTHPNPTVYDVAIRKKLQGEFQNKIKQVKSDQYPYSAIGFLYVEFEKYYEYGYNTAFLVGSNIAITAAHCIYKRHDKKIAKKIQIILSLSGKQGVKYQIAYVFIPNQFKNSKKQSITKFDFAVLILNKKDQKEQLKQIFGYLPIKMDLQNLCAQKDIQISGFIQKRNNSKNVRLGLNINEAKTMFEATGKIISIQNGLIKHLVDIDHGLSGTPIIQQLKILNGQAYYEVLGVQIMGNWEQNYNIGVLLTENITKRLNQWIFHLDLKHPEKYKIEKSQNIEDVTLMKNEIMNKWKDQNPIYNQLIKFREQQIQQIQCQNKISQKDALTLAKCISNKRKIIKKITKLFFIRNIQQLRIFYLIIGDDRITQSLKSKNEKRKRKGKIILVSFSIFKIIIICQITFFRAYQVLSMFYHYC